MVQFPHSGNQIPAKSPRSKGLVACTKVGPLHCHCARPPRPPQLGHPPSRDQLRSRQVLALHRPRAPSPLPTKPPAHLPPATVKLPSHGDSPPPSLSTGMERVKELHFKLKHDLKLKTLTHPEQPGGCFVGCWHCLEEGNQPGVWVRPVPPPSRLL